MKIYNYSPETGEFIGSETADPDPLQENEWLIPAFATSAEPPALTNHQAAVFGDGEWAIVPDYRGVEYWLSDRSYHTIDQLGFEPPEDALFEQPPEPVQQRRLEAKTTIDQMAGRARLRFVSAGQLIEEEYREAEKAVQEWRTAGSPTAQVPEEISAWIDAANMTAEEAATDIEQTAVAWKQVLTQIRTIRLTGKAAIDNAADDADFMAIAQPYIDQLDAMGPSSS
ncbi:hypothetical protein [Marinobacter alkaliphilus]|uniref:Tail fiber assembly protein n=1 Tax=Marinobacter alkaliphilus TaxID=254719 RepID=A0ABZ3E5X8_9GAMM